MRDSGLRRQRIAGCAGLIAHQHVERILRAVERGLQRRHGRLDLRQGAFGLAQLQLGGDAFAILQADGIDQPALRLDLALRDRDPRLQPADGDIGVGDLRGDGESCGGGIRARGLPVVARRLALPAQPAEDVHLPARAEIELIKLAVALHAGEGLRNLADRGAEGLLILRHLAADLARGQQGRIGRSQGCTRLADAGERLLQVEIAVEGAFDRRGQHRIVEAAPPMDQIDRTGRATLDRRLSDEGRGRVVGGSDIMGADRAARKARPGEQEDQDPVAHDDGLIRWRDTM